MKVDINKPVKLRNPLTGEENIVFRVSNYNDVTDRCYIYPVNLSLKSHEIVSVDDIENVEL